MDIYENFNQENNFEILCFIIKKALRDTPQAPNRN